MIFASDGAVPEDVSRYVIVGELALDGRVRPVRGVLSLAMMAKREKFGGVIVPAANSAEAGVVDGIDVYPVNSLTEAVGFLTSPLQIEPVQIDMQAAFESASKYDRDFADVT